MQSTIIHDGVAHSLNCRCCAGLASCELILIIDRVGLGAGSSAATGITHGLWGCAVGNVLDQNR